MRGVDPAYGIRNSLHPEKSGLLPVTVEEKNLLQGIGRCQVSLSVCLNFLVRPAYLSIHASLFVPVPSTAHPSDQSPLHTGCGGGRPIFVVSNQGVGTSSAFSKKKVFCSTGRAAGV